VSARASQSSRVALTLPDCAGLCGSGYEAPGQLTEFAIINLPWALRRSCAHRRAKRIVRRGFDDPRLALGAHDMHAEFGADLGCFRRDEGHGQALSNRMAIASRGHEADNPARAPDRLVAACVCVQRVDLERDQLALGRRTLALHERRLSAK